MYRFLLQPRWIGLLLTAIAVAIGCVGLGRWQLDRLADREVYNSAVESAQAADPVAATSLLTAGQPVDAALEWRPVTATGLYDVANEVLLRGQLNAGRAGYHVLTPLVTADGAGVLVNRGWIPVSGAGDATSAPDVPPPPPGEVTVLGRIRQLDPVRAVRVEPAATGERLVSVDVMSVATDLPYPTPAAYVELVEQDPPGIDQPELLALPDLGEGPHLAYAVQWFLFSGLGFLGYVLFARQEAQRRRAGGLPDQAPVGRVAPPPPSGGSEGGGGAELSPARVRRTPAPDRW